MELSVLISWFISGQGVVALLVIWFFLETIIILIGNYNTMVNKFDEREKKILDRVNECSSRALNLTAITFAAITFLIVGFKLDISNIKDSLIIFVFGLFCFIISYKFAVFGATRRIYWSVQQRFLNFGLLSLIFGLLLFFNYKLPEAIVFISIIALIIVMFHVKEFISDYKSYTKLGKK